MEESLYHRLIKSILIGAGAIVVLIGALFVLDKLFPGKIMKKTSVPAALPTLIPASKNNTTVMIGKVGFLPEELRVNPGATINFANLSDKPIRMVSDVYKPLSIGTLIPGQVSADVVFPIKGIFEYYNANKPSQKGRIIVE